MPRRRCCCEDCLACDEELCPYSEDVQEFMRITVSHDGIPDAGFPATLTSSQTFAGGCVGLSPLTEFGGALVGDDATDIIKSIFTVPLELTVMEADPAPSSITYERICDDVSLGDTTINFDTPLFIDECPVFADPTCYSAYSDLDYQRYELSASWQQMLDLPAVASYSGVDGDDVATSGEITHLWANVTLAFSLCMMCVDPQDIIDDSTGPAGVCLFNGGTVWRPSQYRVIIGGATIVFSGIATTTVNGIVNQDAVTFGTLTLSQRSHAMALDTGSATCDADDGQCTAGLIEDEGASSGWLIGGCNRDASSMVLPLIMIELELDDSGSPVFYDEAEFNCPYSLGSGITHTNAIMEVEII